MSALHGLPFVTVALCIIPTQGTKLYASVLDLQLRLPWELPWITRFNDAWDVDKFKQVYFNLNMLILARH